MGMFRKVFMKAAGLEEEPKRNSYEWKLAHLTPQQLALTQDNTGRYISVPAIPVDIGFDSGIHTGGQTNNFGVVSQVASNPGVIFGMGLTTLALLGIAKSSFIGDKIGAQKYMQYRILAQFLTVSILVAGVTIFGSTYENPHLEEKQ